MANGTFSNIPRFLLEKYFNEIIENIQYSGSGTTVGPTDEHIYSNINKSMLFTWERFIIADGGFWTPLYIKNNEEFIQVKFVPGNPPVENELNNFKFVRGPAKSMIYTPENIKLNAGDEVYLRNDSFFHDWWSKLSSSDNKSYFNKDKLFTYLGKIYKTDEFTKSSVVKTTSEVSEELYGVNNTYWQIAVNGLKDWALAALPEHQQTTNVKELFNIYFDKVHSEIYNKSKDLWALLVPMEIPIDLLTYIAKGYGISINENLSEIKQREFVRDIIHFLKRKGTYTSLYIIWYLFTLGTTNRFNVYERWHDWNIIGNPEEYFTDALYQSFYGVRANVTGSESGAGNNISGEMIDLNNVKVEAGKDSYYDYWFKVSDYPNYDRPSKSLTPSASKQLSSHYRIELDLSSQPLDYDEATASTSNVISKDLITPLVENWEMTRPVSRYSHYNYLMGLPTDFSGDSIDAYNDQYGEVTGTHFTQSSASIGVITDSVIHKNIASENIWTIVHNLNSYNIIVQCYDHNFNMIEAKKIKIVDVNTLTIEFATSIFGWAFVVKAQNTTSGALNVIHDLGTVNFHVQGIDSNEQYSTFSSIVSDTTTYCQIKNVDPDLEYRALFSVGDFASDYTTSIGSPHNATVTHSLGSENIFVSAFDFVTYESVNLTNIEIIDSNNINVETSSSQHIIVVVSVAAHSGNFTNKDTVILSHSLGSPPLIYIYDTSTNLLITPTSITHNSSYTSATIVLPSTISGRIAYDIADSIKYTGGWNVEHSIGEKYILSQVYDVNKEALKERETILIDINNMAMIFSKSLPLSAGTVSLEEYDYIHWQDNGPIAGSISYSIGPPEIKGRSKMGQGPAQTWNINHNLGYLVNLIQFFDIDNHQIYPDTVTIVDANKITATFAEPMLGYAILKIVGNIDLNDSFAKSIVKYKIGDGSTWNYDADTENDLENIRSEGPIKGFREDDSYYYVDVFDTKREIINITEVGLFDNNEDLLFYTKTKPIYKPKDIDTRWHFKIRKLSF